MNSRFKDHIAIFQRHASHKDRNKVKLLLRFAENNKIKNIKHLAEVISSPLGSTSRLVNRIGYEHFRDFKEDLNYQNNNLEKTWLPSELLISEGIAIICSKRSHLAGDFLKAKLNNHYNVVLFKGKNSEVEDFVFKNQFRLFILITITGDSHRVSIAIAKIATLTKTPKVIISSYALYLSIFKKYDHLQILKPHNPRFKSIRNHWDEDVATIYLMANVFEFLQCNLE